MALRVDSRDAGARLPRTYRFGLTAASALALVAFAPQALAQDAPGTDAAEVTDEDGGILVTGIRFSIANSVNTKRNADSIVEAVSAEDIGKLPDQSIAESIARLPGLAAQRVNGRAQVISLRGLSPDFTTTLLNGRQQASSGDNRSVEFDQYPSELLNSVVIYKTPDASIAGMGLAGSADLRTVRPLEYGKTAIALNLRGELNTGGKLNDDVRNWGWRGSASWIGQNEDGTLGWALGYAHLDSPTQTRHTKLYNYETFCCGIDGNISPADARTSSFVTGQEVFATSRENKRDAMIGILEFQPSDAIHSTLDLYYSRFKQREVMRGAQWFSNVWADSQTFTNVGTTMVGGTSVGVTGTTNGVAPQLRNDYNTRDDKLFSVGWNNELALGESTKLVADLSYSRNKRDESITETYQGYGTGATAATQNANRTFDSIAWDFTDALSASGGFPRFDEGLNYADANQVSLGDRAPWGGWGHDGATKEPQVIEKVWAIDLGIKRDLGEGFFRSVELGGNYTRRTKTKAVAEYDLFLKNDRAQTLVGSQYLVDPTSLGFAGMGNVLAIDLKQALPTYYDKTVYVDPNTFDKAWGIEEDIFTARAKVQLEAGPLRGNIGLQMVHQKQQSEGFAINTVVTPRVVTPVSKSASYTDWLPSLNLILDLGGGHRLRFAASKVLARPRMDEMRASFIPSFSNPCAGAGGSSVNCQPGGTINPWNGNGGNALLEPWRAKAIDVAYEWYIDKSSYVSIAGFHKHLDNYIYTQSQVFDFTGLQMPTTAIIPAGVTVSTIGQINQPANGKGGYIQGIELSGALGLGKLASVLDGFGIIGSYAYTKSNLRPTASTNATTVQATRIPGLSGTVWNLTGYFEQGGFQARASYRYRSAFKGEVVQLFAARGATEILADKQLDAQIGYTFGEESSLSGLSIMLQANNLTDSPYRTRLGVDDGGAKTADGSFLPETYEKYGRQFLVGFGYRF